MSSGSIVLPVQSHNDNARDYAPLDGYRQTIDRHSYAFPAAAIPMSVNLSGVCTIDTNKTADGHTSIRRFFTSLDAGENRAAPLHACSASDVS